MVKRRQANTEELENGIGEEVVLTESVEVEESAEGIKGLPADEEVRENDL